ncbi:signal peptidase II [Syntrophomonas erecta]
MRFWLSFILVLIFDQVSKWQVTTWLSLGESHPLINGFLYLTYVQNQGAAFGILPGKSWFFIVAAALVMFGLVVYNLRHPLPDFLRIILGIIVGGAAGNFVDRWRFNYVIDFLDLRWWPVFNLADMAIVGGAILLIIYVLRHEEVG